MVFNCKSTGSLKIKGEQGIIVTVEGDTISIGIDPETFPAELTGDTTELERTLSVHLQSHEDGRFDELPAITKDMVGKVLTANEDCQAEWQ